MEDDATQFILSQCMLAHFTSDELPEIANLLISHGVDHPAIWSLAAMPNEPDSRNITLMKEYIYNCHPSLIDIERCVAVYVSAMANRIQGGLEQPEAAVHRIVDVLTKTKMSTHPYQYFFAVAYDCDLPNVAMEERCFRAVDNYLLTVNQQNLQQGSPDNLY